MDCHFYTVIIYSHPTLHMDAFGGHRWLVIGHITLILTSQSLSQSQYVRVICSHWVSQHCNPSENVLGVSSPNNSGSRATSRDTGESVLRDLCTQARLHRKLHFLLYSNATFEIRIWHYVLSAPT